VIAGRRRGMTRSGDALHAARGTRAPERGAPAGMTRNGDALHAARVRPGARGVSDVAQ